MRDWAVAILLGALVLVVLATGTILSVLLTPVAMFAVIVFGIWFLLQLLKEGDGENDDRGSGP